MKTKIIIITSITLNVILLLLLAYYLTPIARYKYYGSSTSGSFYRINKFTSRVDLYDEYKGKWVQDKSE